MNSQRELIDPLVSFNLPSHLLFRLFAFIFTSHVVIPSPAQKSVPCPRQRITSQRECRVSQTWWDGWGLKERGWKPRVLKNEEELEGGKSTNSHFLVSNKTWMCIDNKFSSVLLPQKTLTHYAFCFLVLPPHSSSLSSLNGHVAFPSLLLPLTLYRCLFLCLYL